MFAQSSGETGATLRINLRGMPMAGATYAATDHLDVRLLAGYFQRTSWDYKIFRCPSRVDCWPQRVSYRVHEYGAALSGLYDLMRWKMITLEGGAEVGYVLAHAPDRPPFVREQPSTPRRFTTINDRLSITLLAGVSARPFPWLAVFFEAGMGYDRGMPRRNDLAPPFLLRENLWGLTHLSPGLRVSL
jgi:hypothetical protein